MQFKLDRTWHHEVYTVENDEDKDSLMIGSHYMVAEMAVTNLEILMQLLRYEGLTNDPVDWTLKHFQKFIGVIIFSSQVDFQLIEIEINANSRQTAIEGWLPFLDSYVDSNTNDCTFNLYHGDCPWTCLVSQHSIWLIKLFIRQKVFIHRPYDLHELFTRDGPDVSFVTQIVIDYHNSSLLPENTLFRLSSDTAHVVEPSDGLDFKKQLQIRQKKFLLMRNTRDHRKN